MYEKKQGAHRLTMALYRRAEDSDTVQRLAILLNYTPEQLKQDIHALHDYVTQDPPKKGTF